MAHLHEHFIRRSLQRFSADDRAYGDDIVPARSQRVPYTRDGEDWADADQRITGADHDAFSRTDRLQHVRCWPRRLYAIKLDPTNARFGMSFDQVFLKNKPAFT